MTTLYDLNEGEEGIILKIKGRGQFRQRLSEMGFVVGKKVFVVKKAPLRDPIEYKIMGYHISLRNSEAQLIEVDRGSISKELMILKQECFSVKMQIRNMAGKNQTYTDCTCW